ncbi:MAG: recombinase family protein [Devosia sp.]
MSEQTIFRCAVYTRKSSEEGLEQDFNSLEAQREACEAYIRSQSHEGWKLIVDRFDDGGFSGGNMERPALGKLMSRIRDGKVDVIVIYKIDRLTRSLTDFARLAETFDKHGVSFVSVTQQFNTTTSMGRLMLNVLLSFAQFEREITGERIRDKIAASKRKGMWMGGPIPMGYDVKDRQLVINETEAPAVRRVFELYHNEGNVPALLERLMRERIKTPLRTSTKGKQSGDRWFTRGHVYKLLSNPLYIGRIAHKEASHPGQHEAIIDNKTWEAVQSRLEKNTQGERRRRRRADPQTPLLAGLLFSEAGHPMFPMHSVKSGRRYNYYVEQLSNLLTQPDTQSTSMAAHLAGSFSGANRQPALRLPAVEIDQAVIAGLKDFLLDKRKWLDHLGDMDGAEISTAATNATQLVERIDEDPAVVAAFVTRAFVGADRLCLTIDCGVLQRTHRRGPEGESSSPTQATRVDIPLTFRRRGRQLKLSVDAVGGGAVRSVDATLVTAVARAFDWFDRLASGQARSIDEIAASDGFDAAYVSHLLSLAFIAPTSVASILVGSQRLDLTADRLVRTDGVPNLWPSDHAGQH